jgi:hypothetical protein
MKLDALFLAGVATGLSACAAAPARAPEVAAETAAFPVTVEGASYQAIVTPGASGQALTGAGAQTVAGRTIRVAPLAYDQGKRAKDVAQRACDQARGRFQPQALGRFAGNEWIFEGGCA